MTGWARVPAFLANRLDGARPASEQEAWIDILARWNLGEDPGPRALMRAWGWGSGRIARFVRVAGEWAAENGARLPERIKAGQQRDSSGTAAGQPESGTTTEVAQSRDSSGTAAGQQRYDSCARASLQVEKIRENTEGSRPPPAPAGSRVPVRLLPCPHATLTDDGSCAACGAGYDAVHDDADEAAAQALADADIAEAFRDHHAPLPSADLAATRPDERAVVSAPTVGDEPGTAGEGAPSPIADGIRTAAQRRAADEQALYATWRAHHPRCWAPTPTPDTRKGLRRILAECGGLDEAGLYVAWVHQAQDVHARQLRGEAPWPDGDTTVRTDLVSLARHIAPRLAQAEVWAAQGRATTATTPGVSPAAAAWSDLEALTARGHHSRTPPETFDPDPDRDLHIRRALGDVGGWIVFCLRDRFTARQMRAEFLAAYDRHAPRLAAK